MHLHYLVSIVCFVCANWIEVIDLFRLLFLFNSITHYSMELMNKRNQVVLCISLRLTKQLFKFGQSCAQKNTQLDTQANYQQIDILQKSHKQQ